MKTHDFFHYTVAVTNLDWEWTPESNRACLFCRSPKASWIISSLPQQKFVMLGTLGALWHWRRKILRLSIVKKTIQLPSCPLPVLEGESSFNCLEHVSDEQNCDRHHIFFILIIFQTFQITWLFEVISEAVGLILASSFYKGGNTEVTCPRPYNSPMSQK